MNQDFRSSLKRSLLLIHRNFHITIAKYCGWCVTPDLYSQGFSLESQSRQIVLRAISLHLHGGTHTGLGAAGLNPRKSKLKK